MKLLIIFIAIFLNAEVIFEKGWNLKGGMDLNLSLFKNFNVLIWKYENQKWKYFSNEINITKYPKIETLSKKEGFYLKAPFKMILMQNEIASNPYYKYKNLLNNSYLQLETSNNIIKNKNFFNENFYLSNNKYLAFYMCGEYKRSELRFNNEFGIDENKSLSAVVKLNDLNSTKYTFIQIFNKDVNKPLVRIAYYKQIIKGVPDKIWAVINSNEYFLLTDLREFNISLKVNNFNLKIFINNTLKVDYNFSQDSTNYFKLGVYLQDNGCAKNYFKDIAFN